MKLFRAALLLGLIAASSATICRKRPFTYTPALCARPPVDAISLPAYAGTWFQIFTNPGATVFSEPVCTTARYTPRAGGIDVLNCSFLKADKRAGCVRARATVRAGAGSVSRLQVDFGRGIPAGDYNVAALLGDAEYGYYAAAVFSCVVIKGKARTIWFFIARTPFRPWRTLWQLQRKLRCKGYPVYLEKLTKTRHGRGCKYFFNKGGFKVRPRLNPSAAAQAAAMAGGGGPPPGVLAGGAGGPPPGVLPTM